MKQHIMKAYGRVKVEHIASGEITNKMQPCNRIYYSTVY
jgi:hypothetical protein